MISRWLAGCAVAACTLLGVSIDRAVAQPPFGGFSGGFRPDPDEIVSRMDANGNGQVEPEEMEGRSRFFLEGLARDNNLDLSKPIKADKLRELLRARWGGGSSSGSSSSSKSKSSSAMPAVATPGVMGFGIASTGEPPKVPGFGPPPSADSWDVLKQKYGNRVVEEVEEDLERYDRDKDGQLDPEELKNGRWRGNPLDYDKNKDGKLSKSELADREIGKDSGSSSNSGGSSSSSSGSSSGYGGYRGPPGGGFSGGGPPGGGFGGFSGYGDRSSSSSSGSSSSSSSSDDERYVRYAEGMLRQYDKNNDGKLQKDEWSSMRGEPQKADRDGDNTITKDELAKYLASYSRSSSSSGGSSSSSGSTSAKSSSGERKSYRFLTAAERLPDGLPDWFADKDADGDGQILMGEYSKSWDDAKAKEFVKYDLNGDGIITPAECLKK